jgi:hypothetical protein
MNHTSKFILSIGATLCMALSAHAQTATTPAEQKTNPSTGTAGAAEAQTNPAAVSGALGQGEAQTTSPATGTMGATGAAGASGSADMPRSSAAGKDMSGENARMGARSMGSVRGGTAWEPSPVRGGQHRSWGTPD